MIAIIDYGAGNIFSVKNALDFIGLPNILTSDKAEISKADGIILPGVGAFPNAMKMLNNSGLTDLIKEEAKKKPFLGICLGMQMLFEKGYEFSETDGLGLIQGSVEKMKSNSLRIPHIGWNKLDIANDCPLLKNIGENEYVYFVHSYKANCDIKNVSAYCDYGSKVPALVFKDNIFGAQFHPEKSGKTGLKILKNFGGLL
ncbi:MAG: imidazole glycerol phosphate synthase subunit HisH [Oscillospiraceae bacterium]